MVKEALPPLPGLSAFSLPLALSFSFLLFSILQPVCPAASLLSGIPHRRGSVSALPSTPVPLSHRPPAGTPAAEAWLPCTRGSLGAPPEDWALKAACCPRLHAKSAPVPSWDRPQPGGRRDTYYPLGWRPNFPRRSPAGGVHVGLPPARSWRPPSRSYQAPGCSTSGCVSLSICIVSSLALLRGP